MKTRTSSTAKSSGIKRQMSRRLLPLEERLAWDRKASGAQVQMVADEEGLMTGAGLDGLPATTITDRLRLRVRLRTGNGGSISLIQGPAPHAGLLGSRPERLGLVIRLLTGGYQQDRQWILISRRTHLLQTRHQEGTKGTNGLHVTTVQHDARTVTFGAMIDAMTDATIAVMTGDTTVLATTANANIHQGIVTVDGTGPLVIPVEEGQEIGVNRRVTNQMETDQREVDETGREVLAGVH